MTKVVLGGMLFCSFGVSAWASGKLYWSDWSSNKIQSANLDGTGITDIATGLNSAKGDVAIDIVNNKIFWIDRGTGLLQKSNFDGSSVQTVASGIGSGGRGLDLDVANEHIYYGDYTANTIKRVNFDGTGVTTILQSLGGNRGHALDLVNGRIYWTEDTSNKVRRANLDGSSIEDLVTTGLSYPYGIILDIEGGEMYFSDLTNNAIYKANLDGSNRVTLISGLSQPLNLELDLANNHLYWADESTQKIERCNLDGTGRAAVVSGLSMPIGLAVDLSNNLASTAIVTAEGSDTSFPISNVTDGRFDTRWNAQNDDTHTWIDFNWSEPVQINTVEISEFRSRVRLHHLRYGEGLGAVPGMIFSPADFNASANHPSNQQNPVSIPDHKITFPTITTQRLRYQVSDTVDNLSEPSIWEIKIFYDSSLSVVNQQPMELDFYAPLLIAENQPIGSIVGEFNATDPEGGAITYHFVNGDNNNSLFTLETNGTLKTATVLDYEADPSTYTITVQAKDELNATTEGNFTVTLLNDAPSTFTVSGGQFGTPYYNFTDGNGDTPDFATRLLFPGNLPLYRCWGIRQPSIYDWGELWGHHLLLGQRWPAQWVGWYHYRYYSFRF